MRIIFYYFVTDAYNQSWTEQYHDELRRAGHDLRVVKPLLELGRGLPRGRYDEYIVDLVEREHKSRSVGLFFASARQNELGADAVARIRSLGIHTMLAVWDNILVPHRVKKIASAFDICWVTEPEAVATYETYGARVFHDTVAANPHTYAPTLSPEDVDVSFVGQRSGVREHYAENLAECGIPVELYGVGWASAGSDSASDEQQTRLNVRSAIRHTAASLTHANGRAWARAALVHRLRRRRTRPEIWRAINDRSHPPLPFPEMVDLYSRSKISLGFNELGRTYLLRKPLYSGRLRDFEAPMSGACYIMYRMPNMQACFEEDREILFYSSMEELGDKIRFYLDPRRDSARAEIKRRARERAVRDHTWMHRFSSLFRELDLAG